MPLHSLIEQHWHTPKPWLNALLWLPSRLFGAVARLRRLLYRHGCLKTRRLPVPLAVIGNIHAGGTGKTPITAALVRALQQNGIRVGIISRGYGRTLREPHLLTPDSNAAQAGDEPLMLYRQTGAPTAVAADRFQAGALLLAQHPDLQLIVADDGLQHYALARDLEIAVYPAAHTQRLPKMLPDGALREPLSRLRQTDAVVFSQAAADFDLAATARNLNLDSGSRAPALFVSHLQTAAPYRLHRPQETLPPDFSGSTAALAAIARPERFFDSLRARGIRLDQTFSLPDHAPLSADKLPEADHVFITEKDAAKLLPAAAANGTDSGSFADKNVWVMPVCAIIAPDLAQWIAAQLNSDCKRSGAPLP